MSAKLQSSKGHALRRIPSHHAGVHFMHWRGAQFFFIWDLFCRRCRRRTNYQLQIQAPPSAPKDEILPRGNPSLLTQRTATQHWNPRNPRKPALSRGRSRIMLACCCSFAPTRHCITQRQKLDLSLAAASKLSRKRRWRR